MRAEEIHKTKHFNFVYVSSRISKNQNIWNFENFTYVTWKNKKSKIQTFCLCELEISKFQTFQISKKKYNPVSHGSRIPALSRG